MARKFVVKPENNKTVILVDGAEIEDVTAYTIRENAENGYAEVTLSFVVWDKWLVFKGDDTDGPKKPDPAYLKVLQEDLAHAKSRLENADPEGKLYALQVLYEVAREIDRYMAYNKERGKEDGESDISRPSDPSSGTVPRTGDDHGGGSRPTGGV